MREDNATFAAANAAASKDPRFTLALSFDTDNTDILYLTSHADDAHPVTTQLIPNCVRSLSGVSQRVIPEKAESSIGSLSFAVLDRYDENSPRQNLTEWIETNLTGGDGLRAKRVQVYVGFEGMAWTDYELRYTYVVDDVDYRDGVYTFRCSDPQRFARKEIFQPDRTTLSASITATQTHIPCSAGSTTTSFYLFQHDAGYSDAPSTLCSYIKLNDEIIRVGSEAGSPVLGNGSTALYTHPTDGISFHVLERGALSTTAVAHDTASGVSADRQPTIEEYIYLEGPAPKLAYALLTGILEGDQNSSPETKLPDHWNAGVSTAYVRVGDFTGIGADLWDTSAPANGRRLRFTGLKKADAKQFLEREVLRWLGCYLPVYSNGELGLRQLQPVLSDAGYVAVLDDDVITQYSELQHDLQAVINEILIQWNWDETKDQYTRDTLIIDSTSISEHQKAPRETVRFRGVTTGGSTDRDLRVFTNTLRDRYANPPQRLQLGALPSLNTIEVGDTVLVQSSNIRDYVTGTTISRVFEVQQLRTDWLTGELQLSLFASSGQPSAISTEAGNVVANAYYEQGTLLSTPLTISGNAVTSSGSLSSGDYHWLNDLTINSGVTVTINGTVRLFIRGSLTINGDLDGAGNGAAAGTGQTTVADNSTAGTAGGIGRTFGSGGLHLTERTTKGGDLIDSPLLAEVGIPPAAGPVPFVGALPIYALRNRTDESPLAIDGLPTNLQGTGGGGGLAAIRELPPAGPSVQDNGGNGGTGGAGLMILSRGGGFGPSGGIDTSGNNGTAGTSFNYNAPGGVREIYSGSGAGGFPGGVAWFLDGNVADPGLVANLTANSGTCTVPATTYSRLNLPNPIPPGIFHSNLKGAQQLSHSQACARTQYIPAAETVEAEPTVVHQIGTPAAPSLAKSTLEDPVLGPVGTLLIHTIVATLTQSTDPDAIGYEVQGRRSNESAYQTLAFLNDVTQTEVQFRATEGIAYVVRYRVLSKHGADGHSAFSAQAALTLGYTATSQLKEFQQVEQTAQIEWGFSVHITENGLHTVVGAPTNGTGSVTAYVKNGTFTQTGGGNMTSQGSSPQFFGWSTAISDNGVYVVVGDPFENTSFSQEGRVEIRQRTSGGADFGQVWAQVGGVGGYRMGESVDINEDGTVVAIGAPPGSGNGRIYIVERDAAGGSPEFTQIELAGVSSERLGRSVVVSGDGTTVAAAAPNTDGGFIGIGRIRVYRKTGSPLTWTNVFTIDDTALGSPSPAPSGIGADVVAGLTINYDGSRIAFGADDDSRVWVFTEDASPVDSWSLEATITGTASERFGAAIDFDKNGTQLLIGAPDATVKGFANAGQAHLYRRDDDAAWSLIQTIEAAEPGTGRLLGRSISMGVDTAIIGTYPDTAASPIIPQSVHWYELTNRY